MLLMMDLENVTPSAVSRRNIPNPGRNSLLGREAQRGSLLTMSKTNNKKESLLQEMLNSSTQEKSPERRGQMLLTSQHHSLPDRRMPVKGST